MNERKDWRRSRCSWWVHKHSAKRILPSCWDASCVYDFLCPEKFCQLLYRLPDLGRDLLIAWCATLRMYRIDHELLVLPVHVQVSSAYELVTVQDGVNEGPEFSFVFWQKVLVEVVEAEYLIRSRSKADEIVEWSQKRHSWLPRVRIHRFKEPDVLVMDIPLVLTVKPCDVNSMYRRFLL